MLRGIKQVSMWHASACAHFQEMVDTCVTSLTLSIYLSICQTGWRRTGFDWWSTEQTEEPGWHHRRVWRVGLLHAVIIGPYLLVRDELIKHCQWWCSTHCENFVSLSSKTDRVAKGSECFQRSLTLNPFLWSPFQNLCHLGNTYAHTHFHFYLHLHVLMHLNVCSRREARSRAGVQIVIYTEHFDGPTSSTC